MSTAERSIPDSMMQVDVIQKKLIQETQMKEQALAELQVCFHRAECP